MCQEDIGFYQQQQKNLHGHLLLRWFWTLELENKSWSDY